MALTDWKNRLKQMLATGMGDGTRRPDGGTSCYRPMRRRMPPDADGSQNYQYAQPVQYVHTGFTGMTPPADFGAGATGYMPQQDYAQTGYAPQAYSQQGFGQTSYMQQDAFAQQTAFGTFDAFSQPAAVQSAGLFQGRRSGGTDSHPARTGLVPGPGSGQAAGQYFLYAGNCAGKRSPACGAYHDDDRAEELLWRD